MSKGHHIGETERAEIVRMMLAGENRRSVARHFKRHEDTVRNVIREAKKEGVKFPKAANDGAFWTDDQLATLKQMHADGESFSTIGARIGCSRNAAIGKAQRLELSRVKVGKPRPRRARTSSPYLSSDRGPSRGRKLGNTGGLAFKIADGRFGQLPKAKRLPPAPPIPPTCEPVSMVDLTDRHCKFPLGDPCGPETMFCGAVASCAPNDRPYCRFHSRLCFNAPERRNIENLARFV